MGKIPKNEKKSNLGKIPKNEIAFWENKEGLIMMKKNYKGRVDKRKVEKCEGVCRTFNELQYKFADLLSESADVQSFQVNVLLDGLELGAYTSDFVATKTDGTLMVRECVYRDKLTKPLTCKMLDASREYWLSHGVTDWGIVIDNVSGEAR